MVDHRLLLAKDQPVLIVDDDASVRTMLATMFKSDGWQVVEAQDGDDGLRVALKSHPWAAVVDVQMPGLGGLQLSRLLRQAGLGSGRLRIIVFTAGMTTAEDAIEAGADCFFLKDQSLLLRRALRADALAPGQPVGGPALAV
ncbi:MAG TPA: response regulator [Candidatus Dormibacteraeota bacterium]